MKNKPAAAQNVFLDSFNKNLQINAIHVNVGQEYIVITEDKTYRCLTEWQRNIRNRESWIAPVSLLGSLTLTFVTATFKDALGVPKASWEAVFILGIAGSALWTLRAVYALLKSRGTDDVEGLIVRLKKGAVIQRATVDAIRADAQVQVTTVEPQIENH